MELEGKITMLFGEYGLRIEITDAKSSTRFLDLKLNQEQVCQAMSRVGNVSCKIEVRGLDNIGKKMENKDFVFELEKQSDCESKKDLATRTVEKVCPKGWEPDYYFNSQNSFFEKDGKQMARCIIRRWVQWN